MTRGPVAKTPYFLEMISCLALILGVYDDSGSVLAGMAMERRRQFRTDFGRVEGGVPESRSGLIIGDLQDEVFPQPLLRRETGMHTLFFERLYR